MKGGMRLGNLLNTALFAAICFSVVSAATAEPEKCTLFQAASLDMNIDSVGRITVPMTLNGREQRMLIDTGGYVSSIMAQTAQSLGLKLKSMAGLNVTMFNGDTVAHYATVDTLKLGNLEARRRDFLVFPESHSIEGTDGTIAPDLLSAYDVEFDFANAKINLYSQDHCRGQVVYWTQEPAAKIPMKTDDAHHMLVPVQLDGESLQAFVDTGAWRTTLVLEQAQHLFGRNVDSGLKPDPAARGEYTYPFKSLTLEGLAVSNPDVVLISKHDAKLLSEDWNLPQLILGMGILRRLHLYVAYREKMLYATAASAH
jgi:predicted aspartyl protease